MLNWFLRSLGGYLGLIFRSFLPQRDGFVPLRPRRILVLLAFIPAFLLMQLVHWIGFLLDEVFFPAYRRVEVKAPLFVLGVPRSGTTLLHRTLAEDEQFTTFQTWECLFALSVTARKFWLAIGAFDHCIGQPLTRALKVAERCLLGSMDGVHYTALRSPEEDYFALTPILGCFILVLPFPFLNAVWRMSDFQHAVPETERRRIMAFYRLCLQKHLYVHGPHRRLLSKNAAFASFTQALQENFPDARFIACLRDPLEVVPSQLSAIRPGL